MKKYLIVLLSIVLTAGMSVAAFADDGGSKVTIGGDARVRGVWNGNFDMNNSVDDSARYWDQRVRLTITGEAAKGVELRTRLTTGDDKWDGANNTGGTLSVDYAYLHVPVGPVVLDLGRQKSQWGNKLLEWDATRDRAKITAAAGPMTVGVYTDKLTDNNLTATGRTNTDDVDHYGIFVIHKAGVAEGGLLVELYNDNDLTTNNNGTKGSVYAKVKAGKAAINVELAIKNGGVSVYETTDKDNNKNETQWGAFASAEVEAGNATINGLLAITRDGYVADKHFTPTLMIGSDSVTALADFGQNPDSANQVAQDSFLAVAGVKVQPKPEMSVYGKAAFLSMNAYGNDFTSTNSKAQAIEVDAGLEYQIAENTTYNIGFGYMFPNDITADNDNVMTLAHALTLKF